MATSDILVSADTVNTGKDIKSLIWTEARWLPWMRS